MVMQRENAYGDCPNHGPVEGVREIPKITFPPMITAVRRAVALRRRPFLCTRCGAAITTT